MLATTWRNFSHTSIASVVPVATSQEVREVIDNRNYLAFCKLGFNVRFDGCDIWTVKRLSASRRTKVGNLVSVNQWVITTYCEHLSWAKCAIREFRLSANHMTTREITDKRQQRLSFSGWVKANRRCILWVVSPSRPVCSVKMNGLGVFFSLQVHPFRLRRCSCFPAHC